MVISERINGYCCRFDFASPTYDTSVALRYEVLRAPLGMAFSQEQLVAEWDQWHLGRFDPFDRLLACLILVPAEEGCIKMRQVAVQPGLQGNGLGRELVAFSEGLAAREGFVRMVLHARESAAPFYLQLGYQMVSDVFQEVGIPHVRMEKAMPPLSEA
jgi:predicted GNAT family N-acyltransferase